MKSWLKKNSPFLLVTGLISLYVLSVLINLGSLNLRVEESRRAIISLEMLHSGNYVQPHTLGWEYYNKPPVFNWILTVFIRIAGDDSEFVLRLPSFICLLILGVCHYLVARRYLTRGVAALSAFFMLTSADLYFYTLSNGAEIDIFYSLIVYLQAISMFWFYEKKNYLLLFLVSWTLCAIGFLTKGYPSLVFQFLTLVALCIHARSWKIILKPQHLAGITAFFLVAGFYYYAYSYYNNPSIPLVNLIKESLQKSAIGEESSGRMHRIFTYPIVLFRVLTPWCLFLLVLLKNPKVHLFSNSFVKFSVLFVLLNIGVYWMTGAQKTRYIVMFIPFVMTIISYVYWEAEKKSAGKIGNYLKYAGLFFLLALVGLLALPFFSDARWQMIVVPATVLLTFLIIFYRVRQYRIWLFITGIILIRLIYAVVGIPVKKQEGFNYDKLAKGIATKNNYQQVYYWDQSDTLDLNVVIGDTLFKWKNKPVEVLPSFIRYQVPYYYYRISGSLVKFDTVMETGRTYVSYNPYKSDHKIEPIDSFYDKHLNKYLILFRKAKPE